MDDLISKQMAKDVVANMEAVGHFSYVTIDKLDTFYPIENEYTIKTTTLGGDRFTEEEGI